MNTTQHLMYRRARPEDANAVDALEAQLQEQLKRCSQCEHKCRTPSPYCGGGVSMGELMAACLPGLVPILVVAAAAALARLL
ncbi:hypothetical protein [Azohydromonas lata]|uniref:hypothetical protein n=1 Tax=Azohydromonas lata TaxID=45677 RepID=UPI00082D7C79|nr:hypothetical protein [Azohydromonas lata]